MRTLAAGVQKEANTLKKSMTAAFGNIPTVPRFTTTLDVVTRLDGAQPPTFNSSVTQSISPAGSRAGSVDTTRHIKIDQLVGQIVLQDVGNKDVDQLVDEILEKVISTD